MMRADSVGEDPLVQNYERHGRNGPQTVVNDKELTKAKDAAYRYLSYRPRSRAEVEKKLIDKNFADTVVQAAMLDLTRLGYIDDDRFARDWTASRIRLRGFGKRRIEQELRNKGICIEKIRETIASAFENSAEEEIARREAEKKLITLSRHDREVQRRRLAGFLERRGFSFEVIRGVLIDKIKIG